MRIDYRMRNSEVSRLVGMRLPCAEGEISGLNSDYKSYDNGSGLQIPNSLRLEKREQGKDNREWRFKNWRTGMT
ncbi:hypothetical protein SAMN04488104_102717 [Algoriphagus faecimaris]|uniref:Uncharacterized protein n=2 Tax=Algoriphagus faecimaris TaxID=686796 RepID=A0A1G6U968_9BACT|nr:hypothetical protein SAMN04488104_102717 [Algoriphagus faecimaris]